MSEILDFIRPGIDVIDILLVAFLFYRIYILLSRTRAMQLLVGFGIIIILDFLARYLNLVTISWIITNVSSYLVFGLIVLLQPELRRLFSEIGRMPIFHWINPRTPVPLDEIEQAVKNMSHAKVGSIIVLLRDIRPQPIIDSAVRLDSLISAEILETIFFKDSPLHDGAVLIENNRIVAASCYLPLTNSGKIKKTFGARHRSALGFSEESDAVIIVTSEETGKISIIHNGEMRPIHKIIELKPVLNELLLQTVRIPENKQKETIPEEHHGDR